jgi:UDP-N-acetylmuramoylalanine--D-glutamate ligase
MEKKPTIFKFDSYKFEPENKQIIFNYRQEFKDGEAIIFTEKILLPEAPNLGGIPLGLLDRLLSGLHLVLGTSYYKLYCAPDVRTPYKLTKEEADFWNTVYRKGLGEFYYRNGLDPKSSPKFSFDRRAKAESYSITKNNKCLVSVSGGKDSIVATELLKEQGFDITAVFTEAQRESEIVNRTIEILGLKSLKFRRILDQKTFDKHKYDGHVPVSAMFAFFGILYAVLYKYSYCVMANEHSSNFGNLKYKGESINHQWSKSSEFENMFREYTDNFLTRDIRYFSLLRPFYEIRIAGLFSKYKKYFPYFSSCNKNFKINGGEGSELWCGQCPKCAFVFTLLSAFLTRDELLNIFKKNLYQDQTLAPLFRDIFGLGRIKPFDCVGTFEESKAAFLMGSPKFEDDFIVRHFLKKVKIKKEEFYNLFKTSVSPNIPSQFRFLGMENVLILGCGKEGEVSRRYIEEKYPSLEIGITDKKDGRDYLKNQNNYDLAIKTPGIEKSLVKIPYITATNLFMSKIRDLGNKIIGVTGSKGKSTTASLIYSILREAGKDVRILGNIGNPMLGVLLEPINSDVIFVVEFSSYQLDDIEFSPDISVVTNLFPEHMDYHKGEKNYYNAKENIIKFQKEEDVFVCDVSDKKMSGFVKKAKAKVVPFANKNFLNGVKSSLIGEHNSKNMLAAVAVAKEFDVTDEVIKNSLENFRPLPHRLEFIGEFKNIKFYDDAISTTPESTIAAIEALENIDTIFLGGQDRGYNFSKLEKTIKKHKIKNMVLFPESGNKIKVKGLNVLKTRSMEKAVEFAYSYTSPGKICLLSCASPSYSLWKDFEQKGNQFLAAVKKLS